MKRRRPRESINVPLASMGDIAMQLIIFFVVSSNMMRSRNAEVKPPISQDIEKIKTLPPLAVVMSRDKISKTISIYVDDLRVERAAEIEDALLAKLVGKWGQDTAKYQVILTIDQECEYADTGPVIKAIAKAGAQILMGGELSNKETP